MQRIALFHIPKTAGSVLRTILQQNFALGELYPMYTEQARAAYREMPAQRKDRIRVVYGHFCLDAAGGFPRDTRRITMLRDPVARLLSHYFFNRDVRKFGPARDLSLPDFLEQRDNPRIDNYMVRCFTGAIDRVPFGRCDAGMLEAAKATIDDFFFTGISERFQESHALLCALFNFPVRYCPPTNVNRKRPSTAEIGPGILARIEALNRLDRELYRHGVRRLEQRLAEVDVSAQLGELRRRGDSGWLKAIDAGRIYGRQRWRRLARKLTGQRQYG